MVVHWATAALRLRRWATLTGLCYVVVKVALLLVIEVRRHRPTVQQQWSFIIPFLNRFSHSP